ncbi:glutathione binding-like protein [Acerihabitans sp. KWT182]|uniref:Glutathione binding-like protein n=1 Tax=Acerihabitans sp. KWT182 TaxID=3157919 RepID=A0AAU7Q8D0_9GAMM
MIDLYYAPTPNGHKITLFLEETGLPYKIHPINISANEQFSPAFLAISPNNKIPAIVDHQPADGGEPLSLFESGAILLYLAEKTGRLLSKELRERQAAIQWLFWQMAGFGPMLGQNHHFNHFAPKPVPYAIERYQVETARLYGVLNRQLQHHAYLAGGDYSIADIATYPWAAAHDRQRIDLTDYPAVKRWLDAIASRPAVERAYRLAVKK